MRTILSWAGIAALAALGWSADNTTPAKKTTSPQKTVTKSSAPVAKKQAAAPSKARVTKRAAASGTTASHPAATKKGPSPAASRPATQKTGSTTTAARRGKKGPPAKRVTWRNRQLAPTPQRYKEIQDALAAKGYLKPEDANGSWGPGSADALKKFQQEQNIEATGKVNSLSLIALGLGPKRDAAPVPAPAPKPLETPPAK
jgi:hypothetical protein